MNTPRAFEQLLRRAGDGERLSPEEVAALATSADVLSLGMIADAVRRHLHGSHVTYVRVAQRDVEGAFDDIQTEAREVRVSGRPDSRRAAVTATQRARAAAGDRLVSGFSWSDVVRLAAADGATPAEVLADLRAAGLEALAEVPVDGADHAEGAVETLLDAAFSQLRLTCDGGSADRVAVALRAAALEDRFGGIRALNPLPGAVRGSGPSTGYDDVRAVAIARIGAPNIATIQVDWQRYGPKLAQVALTFGADDLDAVPAADEGALGHRRALVAEVRRNIEAAAFVPAERDGRFNRLA